jgi:hypothetical protein
MASFVDYPEYLPGEIYRSRPRDKFKFRSKNDIDLFQTFLALQSNPEALAQSTMQLPDMPFGNLSQYMGA